MEQLHSLEELQEFRNRKGISLLQVSNDRCLPCIAIKEKLEVWHKFNSDINMGYISIDEVREAQSVLEVYAAPSIIIYIDGAPSLYKSGYFSLEEVYDYIDKLRMIIE